MLGVKDEVLVDELCLFFRGRFAKQHVEEVGRVAEAWVWVDRVVAVPDSGVSGDDCGGLGGEPDSLPQRSLRRVVLGIGIVSRQGRDGRAEDIHRVSLLGQPDDVEYLAGKLPGAIQVCVEGVELRLRRQLPVHNEVGGLFEIGLLGEIVDVVSAIQQLSDVAVYEAGFGFCQCTLPEGRGEAGPSLPSYLSSQSKLGVR